MNPFRRTVVVSASPSRHMVLCLALLIGLFLARSGFAQELEPRRWSHLPIDTNFLGGGYAYTEGDISFDPVLRLEDVQMEIDTWALKYIRTFALLERSARVEFGTSYQEGHWSGLLDGSPASTSRAGLSDAVVRIAVNLYGAPPLKGKEYASYRATAKVETIVGAALAVHLPTGDYQKDKLINLGSNRYTVRPQLGVTHNRGKWSLEATGAVWFYADNDSFFNGNKLEQDPLYTLQGHLVHNFRPGAWASASAGYGYGGESTLNGIGKDDRKETLVYALSAGYPLSRRLGIKATYLGVDPQNDLGAESDSLIVSLSTFW